MDGGGRRCPRQQAAGWASWGSCCQFLGRAARRGADLLAAAAAAGAAAGAARSSPAPASAWPRSSPAAYSSDAFAETKERNRKTKTHSNTCQCADWSLHVELKHDDMAASNARFPSLSLSLAQ